MRLIQTLLKNILPQYAVKWLSTKKKNLRFRSWRMLGGLRGWLMPNGFHLEPRMQSAFRNFESRRFAEFVARHAGLQQCREIGSAEEGRKLYKIF